MKKKFNVEDKEITIYFDENNTSIIPVVILNTFDEDGETIYNKSIKLGKKDYVLVSIAKVNWNRDLSPWFIEKMFKGEEDYIGGADEYLAFIEEKVIPKVEENNIIASEYILAGYSLAGLFAIYSMYKTDRFSKIVSCSGSLWYSEFVQFAKENNFSSKLEKLYLSLGNKEKNTKNELMSKVEDCTIELFEYYKSLGINCIYEENEGNHFKDPELRIAKGINWILK